jgi:hypothetical protein
VCPKIPLVHAEDADLEVVVRTRYAAEEEVDGPAAADVPRMGKCAELAQCGGDLVEAAQASFSRTS